MTEASKERKVHKLLLLLKIKQTTQTRPPYLFRDVGIFQEINIRTRGYNNQRRRKIRMKNSEKIPKEYLT